MLPSFSVYVVAVVAALIIAGVAVALVRHRRGARPNPMQLYSAGLSYLLAGDRDRALEMLRKSVSLDTNNLEAYIHIGDILREKGQTARAIKIHRELTVRNGLTREQKLSIYRSLVDDYRAAGENLKAAEVLQQILALDRDDLWALRSLVEVYEILEDWEKASLWRKRLQKVRGIDQSNILALYKVEQGRKSLEEGREKEGRVHFREAIKLDPACAPAYLELADSYLREDREKDALKVLQNFVKKAPRQAHLAFARIGDVLFRIGQFGEVEKLLEDMIEEHPEMVRARLALAEIYEKRGSLDEAVRLCERALELDPDSVLALAQLIDLYEKSGRLQDAVQVARSLAEAAVAEKLQFHCSQCNHRSEELFWRCPRCGAWQSAFEEQ